MLNKKFSHNFIQTPKIEQRNLESGRKYVIDDDIAYPSITTVLGKTSDKTALNVWKARVGKEEAEKISVAATTRGTKMHNLCEQFLLNKEMEKIGFTQGELLFKKILPALEKFDNIRALETPLVSHRLGIAGTVDCIADYDGVLTVVDFKSSTRPKKSEYIEDYFIQGSFYFNAFYEMTGELPKQILILISVEDGDLQEFLLEAKDIIKYTKVLQKRKEAYDFNETNRHF
jgi:hypothetical protein